MASPPGALRLLLLLLGPVLIRTCDTEFARSQGSCVPPDCVCDFRNDCGEGSDDEYCE